MQPRTLVSLMASVLLLLAPLSAVPSQNAFAVDTTWARTYGGENNDFGLAADLTSDGGYIVAGQTGSFGSIDAWVFKLDSSGNIEWEKSYGGNDEDALFSIKQTSDGGYVGVGLTWSFGSDAGDFWLLKLDPDGNIEWEKMYGADSHDFGFSVDKTADGGYVAAGFVSTENAGVIKVDSSGEIVWEREFGGSITKKAHFVQELSDSGYLVVGYTGVEGHFGVDGWVAKLDSEGDLEWEKSYGGGGLDLFNSFEETPDGGYVLAGRVGSVGPSGNAEAWVVKIDSMGESEWQKVFASADGYDEAFSVELTTDAGYIIGAQTATFLNQEGDLWLLKLDTDGEIEWERAYGGFEGEGTFQGNHATLQVLQTPDGGYFAIAQAGSFGVGGLDAWALKLDSEGNLGDCTDQLGRDTEATVIESDFEALDAEGDLINKTDSTINTEAVVKNTETIITDPCDPNYTLELFEDGGHESDGVIGLGQEVRAVANTLDESVDTVTFSWIAPTGETAKELTVPSSDARDTFTPDIIGGSWTVKADFFAEGQLIQSVTKTLSITFFVLPESPVGAVAMLLVSLASLAAFMHFRNGRKSPVGV